MDPRLLTSPGAKAPADPGQVYKTPWNGDPRVNVQRGKDGAAKAYQVRQVRQVLDAIARLEAGKSEEGDDDA